MEKTDSWEKLIFAASAGIIVFLSLLGIYLVKVEIPEPYGHLVKAGHSHGLCFAFAAIFYTLLLEKVKISLKFKKYLSYWVLITFLGPLGLLFAGLTRRMNFVTITGIVGDGSFVLLWLVLFFILLTKFIEKGS